MVEGESGASDGSEESEGGEGGERIINTVLALRKTRK